MTGRMASIEKNPLDASWRFYVIIPGFGGGDEKVPYHVYDVFSTVQDFWAYFHHFPLPSELLSDERFRRRAVDGDPAEGIALFKDGVVPEWEDPRNTDGGHWSCRTDMAPQAMDSVWRTLVMDVVGECLESGRHLTGIRIIDKTRGNRRFYRVEVWMDTEETNAIEEVRLRLSEGLGINEWTWHSHVQSIDSWKTHVQQQK